MINLTLNPHKFTHFATWMFVGSLSMPDIILKLSFVDLTVCPNKLAPSVFDIIRIFSIKFISIIGFPISSSLSLALIKLTFIDASIFPFVSTMSFEFSIHKGSNVSISINQLFNSMAILQSIFNLTFIVQAISIQQDATSSFVSILKVPHVFVALFINMLPISMRLAIQPISIIDSKIKSIWMFYVYYFDRSLSVSHSIFELTQIVVFIWNVLESKTVLFSFTGQFSFPISQIENTIKIPNYILILLQLKVYPIFEATNNRFLFAFFNIYLKKFIDLR